MSGEKAARCFLLLFHFDSPPGLATPASSSSASSIRLCFRGNSCDVMLRKVMLSRNLQQVITDEKQLSPPPPPAADVFQRAKTTATKTKENNKAW